MGTTVGVVLLLAFVGVGAMVFFGVRNKKFKGAFKIATIVVIAGLLVAFVFLPFGFVQIEAGELAVVKVWGNARETKTDGLHFRNILSTQYVVYDLKTQEISSDLATYSKDAQSMTAELTVQFKVQADKAIDIARTYGTLAVLTERITAISIEKTKVVLASESAMDLIANRVSLSSRVETSIKNSISQYFVDITMVALTDITFSEAFESTVEQKMIAEQEQLRAEFEKQKAITEAQRDLEVAKLNAEAAIAKAIGQADALIETAKGEAQALKLKTIEVARMLGFTVNINEDSEGVIESYEIVVPTGRQDDIELIQEYLKYTAYLETWDGKLPDVVLDSTGSIIISP